MPNEPNLETQVERILHSPSYRPAYKDVDFLGGPDLRPVRMQLELLKPEMAFEQYGIRSTIVVFGGTQIIERLQAEKALERAKARLSDTPDDARRRRAVDRAERVLAKSHYYDLARQFAHLVSENSHGRDEGEYVIVTGGGPGIMEAANRGAYDALSKSIGLNIRLPREQVPNPYITPELCFQFHYFAIRKFHFLLRAKALVLFPGGYGTIDEMFDALTLRQTGRMQHIPIILFGTEFWRRALDFQYLADEGTILDEHLDLFRYTDSPEEAWEMIRQFHRD